MRERRLSRAWIALGVAAAAVGLIAAGASARTTSPSTQTAAKIKACALLPDTKSSTRYTLFDAPYLKAAFEATARISFPTSRLSFGRDARMLTIAICAVALQPLTGLVAVATLSAVEAVTRSARAFRTLRRPGAERQRV